MTTEFVVNTRDIGEKTHSAKKSNRDMKADSHKESERSVQEDVEYYEEEQEERKAHQRGQDEDEEIERLPTNQPEQIERLPSGEPEVQEKEEQDDGQFDHSFGGQQS